VTPVMHSCLLMSGKEKRFQVPPKMLIDHETKQAVSSKPLGGLVMQQWSRLQGCLTAFKHASDVNVICQ